MSRRNDAVYLWHIRGYAREAIDLLGDATYDEMVSQRLWNLGLLHLITIMGEAANRVSKPTQQAHPQIPWRDIITMRNRSIHGDDQIVPETIWETIKNDLPTLVRNLDEILGKGDSDEA